MANRKERNRRRQNRRTRAIEQEGARQAEAMGLETRPRGASRVSAPVPTAPEFPSGPIGARSAEELMDFGRGPTGASMKMPPGAPLQQPLSSVEGLMDVGAVPAAARGAGAAAGAAGDLSHTFREVPQITKALEEYLGANGNKLPGSVEKAKELFAQMGVPAERFEQALSQKRWLGIKGNPLKNLIEGGFGKYNAEKAISSMKAGDLAAGLTKGLTPVVDFLKGESVLGPSALAKQTKNFATVAGTETGLTGMVTKSLTPTMKALGVVGLLYGVSDIIQQGVEFADPTPSEGSAAQQIAMAQATMISPEDQIYQDMATEAQMNQTLGTMSAYPFLLDQMGSQMGMGGGAQRPQVPGVLPTEISSAGRGGEAEVPAGGGSPQDLLGLGI